MYEIEIKGLDELQKAFKRSPQRTSIELKKAITTSIHMIRPMMRQESPVDTGLMSRSIRTHLKAVSGSVGPNLAITPYALFVNYGTIKQKANPFVDRTAERAEPIVNRIFTKALNKIVEDLSR